MLASKAPSNGTLMMDKGNILIDGSMMYGCISFDEFYLLWLLGRELNMKLVAT